MNRYYAFMDFADAQVEVIENRLFDFGVSIVTKLVFYFREFTLATCSILIALFVVGICLYRINRKLNKQLREAKKWVEKDE